MYNNLEANVPDLPHLRCTTILRRMERMRPTGDVQVVWTFEYWGVPGEFWTVAASRAAFCTQTDYVGEVPHFTHGLVFYTRCHSMGD